MSFKRLLLKMFGLGLAGCGGFLGLAGEGHCDPVKSPVSADGQVEDSFSFAGKTGKFTVWKQSGVGARPGLLVFIHGSGAADSYAAPISQLNQIGKDFNLIIVAVQVPDRIITWAKGSPGDGHRHTEYLEALIQQKLKASYPFDANRAYFVGLSAGSTYLSGDFLPEVSASFKGGVLLLCGGAQPFFGLAKDHADKLKEQYKIYARIDSSDFLYGQTVQAIAFYKTLGFKTFTDITKNGGGHCAFDFAAAVKTGLTKLGCQR